MAFDSSFTRGDIQFQKELPENFEIDCPVCLELLIDEPHLAECCGRHFCGKCSNRLKPPAKSSSRRSSYSKSVSCPMCKSTSPRFNLVRDKSHDRTLGNEVVYCVNKKLLSNVDNDDIVEGCDWAGELNYLKTHLSKVCPCVDVLCPYYCDAGMMKRRDMVEHTEHHCSERPYTCEHCGLEGTFSSINKHYSKCSFYPIPCPLNCDISSIPRSEVDAHLKENCPLQPLECIYKNLGCKEKPLRKDLEEHQSKSHHSVLVTSYEKLTETLESSKEEMRERIQSLESKHKSLQSRHEDLSDCHAKLQKEHNNLGSDHKKLLKKFKRQSKILYGLVFFVFIVIAFVVICSIFLVKSLDMHVIHQLIMRLTSFEQQVDKSI